MAKFTDTDGSLGGGGSGVTSVDPREERLFRALDDDNDEVMQAGDFERVLAPISSKARSSRRLSN